jgi:outer membrane protein OmpA-like peptidoglycan-associated protein
MINSLKNIRLLIIAGLAAVSLTACVAVQEEPNPLLALADVAPKTDAEKQKLYDYLLAERGIEVIKVGETRTIVIASDQLFTADSINFNETYAAYLRIVAQLIKSYDTTNIAVNAYTDKGGDVERALTEKQAQKVMVFLQKHGVDTRLIYAKGYGNLYPVTIDAQNSHFNRRVEIKYQFHRKGGNY